MLNFNSIMIGSENPRVLVEFYEKVFGKKPDMEDGGYSGWLVGGGFINVYEHSEVKGKTKDPSRIMFNLETAEVKQEFERIKAVEGIEIVQEPYSPDEGQPDMVIATFADPDGNYFQLMPPWDDSNK